MKVDFASLRVNENAPGRKPRVGVIVALEAGGGERATRPVELVAG
jgi:hypothetical protein